MGGMKPPTLSAHLHLPLVQAETTGAAVVQPVQQRAAGIEEGQAGTLMRGLARLRHKTPKGLVQQAHSGLATLRQKTQKTSIPPGLPGSSPRPLKRSVCLVSFSLSRARSHGLSHSSPGGVYTPRALHTFDSWIKQMRAADNAKPTRIKFDD